ncbi:MAG TPA: DUF2442 domain-containing protein [Candidatus Kapabacteria bacterium]|nr:DUF2442 domain-containing protein [Candidatus Kapabacteria bacterium]
MIHQIRKIVAVHDLVLALEFDAGEVRQINFEPVLKEWGASPDSIYRELLDVNNFRKVHVTPEWETIYWENGIDLDPNVLYDMSIPVNQVN